MRRAIRKHLLDFAAIIVLLVIAAGVGGYILSNQRLYLPKWVPVLGTDFYDLKAELATAQAVTPGQGQTVNIAGVKVGLVIAKVELENGRALVTMKIRRKYAAVYRDASILLRPKTGLKDMILELTPGTPTTGKLGEGAVIPVRSTLPDINPDEILSALDGDTRDYLRILLGSGAEALRGEGRTISAVLKRFEPTLRDAEKITGLVSQRRRNIARVIHNLRLLSEELATKDRQISTFVNSNNAVLAAFARQDANLRATLRELPSALEATQKPLMPDRLARVLGPSLQALRPFARNLGPTLREVRPVVTELAPIIRNDLRPFTRQALPAIRDLRPALVNLSALTPDLNTVLRVANYIVNELAYNPPGESEGYLFWLTWANHLAGTIFSLQDGNGPIRRGALLLSCSSIGILGQISAANPALATTIALTNLPTGQNICPESVGPGNLPTAP